MPLALPRTTLVPLIVACSLFMETLDGSIVSTAIPVMAKALETDPLHLNLAITVYLFSLALFIPLSGWMADRYGTRTVFRAALLIFTLSSMACGASQNLAQLVLARFIQGVGGSMMVPVGRLVLLKTIPKNGLVDAMAWFTAPALIGPMLGPPLGGLIVTAMSWRWIFLVNVPVGILGIWLVTKYIDNIREKAHPFDARGFLLLAVGLAGLIFGFETIGRDLVPAGVVMALTAIGLGGLGLYFFHAKAAKTLIVDIQLFRLPTFFAASVGGLIVRISAGALPFLMPLMLQIGFGYSPLKSGVITVALAVGAVSMKLCAAPIIRRLGFRFLLIHSAWLASAPIIVCAFFSAAVPVGLLVLVLVVAGFFRSLQFTALNTVIFADVPHGRMSQATTLASMLQELAWAIGVGVGALMLHMTLALRHGAALGEGDFALALAATAILGVLAIPFFYAMPAHAGAEMAGRTDLPKSPEPL